MLLLLARWRWWLAFPVVLVAVAASTAAASWELVVVLQEGTQAYRLGSWAPSIGIEYVVDRLSAFVAVIVTSVSMLVIIATRRIAEREAGDRLGAFYGLVLLLLEGLTGMVVTGDLFNLFVFLEISSLAAYALVFQNGRSAMLAGYQYLILGSIGGSFYLLGVGFLYFTTGTLNMADTAVALELDASARSVQAGAIFIFAGLGLKMALVPLHLWLPDAYTHAPSSVNSLIAPVMTKVGAYAMMRMFISVFPDGYLTNVVPIADALVLLGLIAIVFGAIVAVAQRDIRRMLAYSSIGQIGLIAVGIGLATPLSFVAAQLHLMNHAVMKATLFLSAASVRLSTGLTDVSDLTGMGRRMPGTMAAFTLGAIAMVGIPPTAGFFSKWYLVQAGVESGQWVVVAVVLASSLLSAVYLFRVLEHIYLRPAQPDSAHAPVVIPQGGSNDEQADAGESPADVIAPALLLGAATIVLGILNSWIVINVLDRAGL